MNALRFSAGCFGTFRTTGGPLVPGSSDGSLCLGHAASLGCEFGLSLGHDAFSLSDAGRVSGPIVQGDLHLGGCLLDPNCQIFFEELLLFDDLRQRQ